MLRIAPGITIAENEIVLSFIRASGPGGQNVNKVSTAVQLRFDIAHSPSLPLAVRQRLLTLAGKRVSREGVLVMTAQRFRSQEMNRRNAIERLAALIRQAANPPKVRRPTRPPRAAQQRRLEYKRHRSKIKHSRHGKLDFA